MLKRHVLLEKIHEHITHVIDNNEPLLRFDMIKTSDLDNACMRFIFDIKSVYDEYVKHVRTFYFMKPKARKDRCWKRVCSKINELYDYYYVNPTNGERIVTELLNILDRF